MLARRRNNGLVNHSLLASLKRLSIRACVDPNTPILRLQHDMAKGGFYVVAQGRKTGIFTSWTECEAQVKGYPGSAYKKFPTAEAAKVFLASHTQATQPPSFPVKRRRQDSIEPESAGVGKHTLGEEASGRTPHNVSVYCDGASAGNGRKGAAAGWGVWFADDGPLSQLNESRRLPGPVQTNNRGELMAIIRAVQLAPEDCALTIHTDSQYSIQAINSWQHGWREKKWRRSDGGPVQNKDLIRRLERELRGRKIRPVLKYVKGHAGFYGNEMADRLATHGATLPVVPDSECEDLEPSDSETEGPAHKAPRHSIIRIQSHDVPERNRKRQCDRADRGREAATGTEVLLDRVLPDKADLVTRLARAGLYTVADITNDAGLQGKLVDAEGLPRCGVTSLANELEVEPKELIWVLQRIRAWEVSQSSSREAVAERRLVSAVATLSPSNLDVATAAATASTNNVPSSPAPRFSLSHLSQKFGDRLVSSSASPQGDSRRQLRPIRPPPPALQDTPIVTEARESTSAQSEETMQKARDTPMVVQEGQVSPVTPTLSVAALLEMAPSGPQHPPAPISTGIATLDAALFHHDDGSSTTFPGSATEFVGPTGSGKTRLALQSIARCRLAAVLAQPTMDEAGTQEHSTERATSAPLERQSDFNQCVIIDTEGSISDDDVETAMEACLASLCHEQNRTMTAEEQDRIVSDALDGIFLLRAATLSELMSLLHLLSSPCLPSAEELAASTRPMPPLRQLCAILIDSISYHVRDPADSASDRAIRRFVHSTLMGLHDRLSVLNPRVHLIATNQMTLKMYTGQGDLVNYRTAGSIARMVPQLDLPGGGPDGSGRAWNGVEESPLAQASSRPPTPTAGAMLSSVHSSQSSADAGNARTTVLSSSKDKGRGILGEAAQRVLLFRDGASRYVQLISAAGRASVGSGDSSSSSAWIPFHIEEATGRLSETVRR
ncbi:unnamed protein product [Parajaminaea phylloscopi]